MHYTLTVPRRDPLSQGQRSPVWDEKTTAPSACSFFLPAGSEGHHLPANKSDSLQQLSRYLCLWAARQHSAQTCMRTRQNNLGLRRDLTVQRSEAYRTSSPANPWAVHMQLLEPTATGNRKGLQGKDSDSLEMGLSEAYCSKHFVILWWNVLCKCKVLSLSQTKIYFLISRNFSALPCLPNWSVLYKNKYWKDKRDSSPPQF